MKRIGILLNLQDILYCGEGKLLDAGNHTSSQIPHPQVLAGAFYHTFLKRKGVDFKDWDAVMKSCDNIQTALSLYSQKHQKDLSFLKNIQFQGPWLSLVQEKEIIPLLRMPACVYEEKTYQEVKPLSFPLPGGDFEAIPWVNENLETKYPSSSFWPLPLWHSYLYEGKLPSLKEALSEEELFLWEERTGIAVNEKNVVEEGKIYNMGAFRLRDSCSWREKEYKVSLYCEILVEDCFEKETKEIFPEWIHLGGKHHYVKASCVEEIKWPSYAPQEGEKVHLILATPGLFFDQEGKSSMYPSCLEKPWKACLGESFPLSGFDVARKRPKPQYFGIGAGSLYEVPFQNFKTKGSFYVLEENSWTQTGWGLFLVKKIY